MRIDIHVHTDYSRCSSFGFGGFVEQVRALRLRAVTVTDHGITTAWERLIEDGAAPLVIPGIEVRAGESDFLVFSADADYIRRLGPYRKDVKELRRDEDTVVVWAHPRVASRTGWQAPPPEHPIVERIAPHVDAVEALNHNMMNDRSLTQTSEEYAAALAALARSRNLPMTGGSDAHTEADFFSCWTEFPDGVRTVRDFIGAIRSGGVKPACAAPGAPA